MKTVKFDAKNIAKVAVPNFILIVLYLSISIAGTALCAFVGGALTLLFGTIIWALAFISILLLIIKIAMQWLICSRVA